MNLGKLGQAPSKNTDDTSEVAEGGALSVAENKQLHCPRCGRSYEEGDLFCPACGCEYAAYDPEAKGFFARRKQKQAKQREATSIVGGKVCMITSELSGINAAFEDGIFESDIGRFSSTITFTDVNYEDERDEVQSEIFRRLCELHSYLPPTSVYQFNLVNFREESTRIEDLLPEMGADAEFAQLFNEKILIPRMKAGRTEIERQNFFTVSMPATSHDDASAKLSPEIDGIKKIFTRIGPSISTETLTGTQRMGVMHKLLRGTSEPFMFSYDKLKEHGNTARARDFIAPSWVAYPYDEILMRRELVMPGQCVKVFHIRDFGSTLRDRAIRQIRSLPIPMNISLTFTPQPTPKVVKDIRQNINIAQAAIMDYQVKAGKVTNDVSHIPPALREKEEESIELLEFVQEKDQTINYFQGFIAVYAKTRKKLKEYCQMLMDEAQLWFDLQELPERQEAALTSTLPLATPHLNLYRSLTTAEGAALMPFDSLLRSDDPQTSLLLGQSSVNEKNIYADPSKCASPHMWVFGKTGAGKGMFMKSMLSYMIYRYPRISYNDQIGCYYSDDPRSPLLYTFDFHAEYVPLCDRVGGTISKLGPNYKTCLNPLDIATSGDELDLRAVKDSTDFFLALMADVLGRPLTKSEMSKLDTALTDVYEPHIGKTTRPILHDLYEALRSQDNDDAQNIADAMELFSTGSMNSFDGQTNVVDNPIWNDYDCSELGKTMQTFVILSALQHVRRVARDMNKKGRRTIVILEECQVLFDNEAAVRFLDSMFSEDRKYGLMVICITQLPRRVLQHPRASHLFDNSGIFVFLSQLPTNQELIADMFRMSEAQAECMSESGEPGSGIVVVEGLKMPMKNYIPSENNPLYDLWNTDAGSFTGEGLLDSDAIEEADDEEKENEAKISEEINKGDTHDIKTDIESLLAEIDAEHKAEARNNNEDAEDIENAEIIDVTVNEVEENNETHENEEGKSANDTEDDISFGVLDIKNNEKENSNNEEKKDSDKDKKNEDKDTANKKTLQKDNEDDEKDLSEYIKNKEGDENEDEDSKTTTENTLIGTNLAERLKDKDVLDQIKKLLTLDE